MAEKIEVINQRLVDTYGLFETDKPRYRIVYSEDEFEMRYGTFEDRKPNGALLRIETCWRLVPKYRQYIQNKHILEQLTVVPLSNSGELSEMLSYEPLFVFENKQGEPLPPRWEVIQIVLAEVQKNIDGAGKGPKYKHPFSDTKTQKEVKKAQLLKLKEELFGNETDTTDALAYKEGIVVPRNYSQEKK